MKCVVDLSEVEEITLQQLSINHRHRDARTRAAGLLQLGRKVKPQVIAEQIIEALVQQGDGKPTVTVLDNASIHHSIEQATLDRWFIEHKTLLFYLPPYDRRKSLWDSPELNLIEIVWKHFKYHWRRFVTWTKETIDAELAELLNGYGTKFHVNFS